MNARLAANLIRKPRQIATPCIFTKLYEVQYAKVLQQIHSERNRYGVPVTGRTPSPSASAAIPYPELAVAGADNSNKERK